MINPFYEKLAKLAVNYAVAVKKGDRVLIIGPIIAHELFQALYIEVIKTGAHPLNIVEIEGTQEILFKFGTKEQIGYMDNVLLNAAKEFDCLISIFGDYNPKKLSLVDPSLIAAERGSKDRQELMKIFMKRTSTGEFRWVGIPLPCHAFAQEANMDLFSYSQFIEEALLLNKDDPVKEWLDVEKKQESICEFLETVDIITVIGEDTDLTLSVKDRKWINCCGHKNLPDGEVFTAPIEDSVNGRIRFTFPGLYMGKEIEDITLEFENGRVIKATASKGEQLLQEILGLSNADRLGEFAIGTNYGIQTFTKNMLFDEKIGGTLHCALGYGPPESGSKNISPIHWDILKDMKKLGSKVLADGKVIYEEGKWMI